MDFGIEVEALEEDKLMIALTGRLNAVSAPDLKKKIREYIDKNAKKIVVDLSAVTFMDSSGMASLVAGLKAAREVDGFFRLYGAQKQVLSVLKLTKLDRVFELYTDKDSVWD